jgi:hypothetical protein
LTGITVPAPRVRPNTTTEADQWREFVGCFVAPPLLGLAASVAVAVPVLALWALHVPTRPIDVRHVLLAIVSTTLLVVSLFFVGLFRGVEYRLRAVDVLAVILGIVICVGWNVFLLVWLAGQ